MFDAATLTYVPEPHPDTRQPISLTPSGTASVYVRRLGRLADDLSHYERAELADDLRDLLASLSAHP